MQKDIYKKLLTKSLVSESKTSYKNIIMQLRKVCNHPYLFEGIEDPNAPELGDHLIVNASKMRMLDKLLTKLREQGSQVLIFSQMTRLLDILQDYSNFKQYNFCRIDGNTTLDDRERQIQDFTQPNSEIFLFLLSTRAGGLGLNLMTADTVILFDSDWNPQCDLQAMDRVHRIGQTKPVLIYRFICENTIEEKIIERQAMRLKLDSLVIQQGRAQKGGGENFTKDQMKEMIQYGADAIFRPGDDFKDEEIDIILKRGEESTNAFYEETEKQAKDRSSLLINMSFSSNDLYKFENEDYLKKRKQESERVISLALAEELESENKISRRLKNSSNLNYNIDHNFDQLLAPVKNPKKKTRGPKIAFYHLYKNKEKLYDIKQKQINYFFDNNKKLPEKFDEDIHLTEGLNEEEIVELEEIIAGGFPTWTKSEYEILINSLDKYGRHAYEEIANEITTKNAEEVKNYIHGFFERINDVPDGGKISRNLEKKEKIEKQKELSTKLLTQKVTQSDNSFENIKIIYPVNSKQSEYSVEEDQFLIFLTVKQGYGNWDEIIREIRLSEDFMFNYYLKSRDKVEIQKRVDYLVKVLEREIADNHINLNNIGDKPSNPINLEEVEKKRRGIEDLTLIDSDVDLLQKKIKK